MSFWGMGSFDDNHVMDWAVEFQETPSAHLLDDAFMAVIRATGFIERDLGGYALAAAEVAAAANGKPTDGVPRAIGEWAAAHPNVATRERLAWAAEAIDAVMETGRSGVAELWVKSEYMEYWLARMLALKERLR